MGLKDATNANEGAKAGYRLSGETYRAAAIRRLKKKQEEGGNVTSLLPPKNKP